MNQLKKTHARLTKMHEAWDSKHDKLKRDIVEGKKATAREMQQLKEDHKEAITKLKDNNKKAIVAVKKESKNHNDIALDKQKRGELCICL